MRTIFLGGTCAKSTWRDELIPMLDQSKISAFNPVVEHWDEKAQAEEDYHKENDDLILFCFTPESFGQYAAFEVGRTSLLRPGKVVACFLPERAGKVFEKHDAKTVAKISRDLISDGTPVFDSLEALASYLNTLEEKHSL